MPKRLELLHELVPTARSIAVLVNPNNPSSRAENERSAGRGAHPRAAAPCPQRQHEHEIDAAFATLVQLRAGALLFIADGSSATGANNSPHWRPATMPAIYAYREFVTAGGLMSYGSSIPSVRQAGVYTGRILKGEKPADLPVQQPTIRVRHQPEDRQGARPRNSRPRCSSAPTR